MKARVAFLRVYCPYAVSLGTRRVSRDGHYRTPCAHLGMPEVDVLAQLGADLKSVRLSVLNAPHVLGAFWSAPVVLWCLAESGSDSFNCPAGSFSYGAHRLVIDCRTRSLQSPLRSARITRPGLAFDAHLIA